MSKFRQTAMVILMTGVSIVLQAQQIPEQQLENLAAEAEEETEDDYTIQELEHLRSNPLNMNQASAADLKQIPMLTDLQVESFLTYRRLFGKLLHILELQSVPGWDLSTIRQSLPFIRIGATMSVVTETGQRFRGGQHQLLLRLSQTLEKTEAYKTAIEENGYQGSPLRVLFRYTYRYKNNLQYGLLGDKDAGESFLRRQQKTGFDFYSVHFFARQLGRVQALAIGDFTVNLGQGLIHWQSLAFKKSTEISAIKRQSAVLRPYHSAGENNFHRGIGITLKKGAMESTVFISLRKISSNINRDTINGDDYVSSLLSGGYHRNRSELEDRNNLSQLAAGGNIVYSKRQGHIGINAVYYQYSLPVQKRDEPYNVFNWRGHIWKNESVDYSYTFRNLHFFGEAAIDQGGHQGFINGLLVSADPKVDVTFVHRHLPATYQPVNGNAFTENTTPSNEYGFYTGISIRPVTGWKLDGYLDFYRFPWLKYRLDRPGEGKDWVLQLSYTPNRETHIYSRFRQEAKTGNETADTGVLHNTGFFLRESWRTQLNCKLSAQWTVRGRVELVWYNRKGSDSEKGYLGLLDFLYKPLLKPWSGVVRIQYGETDGYNSRIYAYENDVLYSYAIPVYSGKGYRYYINVQLDIGKRWSVWAKWGQTLFLEKKYVGGIQEGVAVPSRSDLKIQLRYIFQ